MKANEVVSQYDTSKAMMDELIEAIQLAKGISEKSANHAKNQVDQLEKDKGMLEKEQESLVSQLEKLTKAVEEDEKKLKEELDKGGSLNEIVKMIATQTVDQAVPVLASAGGIALTSVAMSNQESYAAWGSHLLNNIGNKVGNFR